MFGIGRHPEGEARVWPAGKVGQPFQCDGSVKKIFVTLISRGIIFGIPDKSYPPIQALLVIVVFL